VLLNNSNRECFLRSSLPFLPTNRKSPAGSCSCRGFELRWKNWESQQRGYWEGTRKRETREVKDTVGDRDRDWGRKFKREILTEIGRMEQWRDAGRQMLQSSISVSVSSSFVPLLFCGCPLLLLTFFPPPLGSTPSVHVFLFSSPVSSPLFSSTSNNPQVFIWSCFGTRASSHRDIHAHTETYWMRSCKPWKCSLTGRMNQVRKTERLSKVSNEEEA